MNKPDWKRIAALELVGRLFEGNGFEVLPKMEAAFDWALQMLDGGVPEQPPVPVNGWTGMRVADVGLAVSPDAPEATRKKVEGLAKAAGRLRADVESALREVTSAPSAETPSRNVPIEGDGSMTVPVYRFYVVHDEPPSTGYLLWREDTRNLHGQHRWSQWDRQNERWVSYASSDDEADLDRHQEAPELWKRITAEELVQVYHVPVESRHDTEE